MGFPQNQSSRCLGLVRYLSFAAVLPMLFPLMVRGEESQESVGPVLEEASRIVLEVKDEDFNPACCIGQVWKMRFWDYVARVQAIMGDRNGLELTSQRAVNVAKGRDLFAFDLTLIGRNLITVGDNSGASKTLGKAFEAAMNIKIDSARDSILPGIAELQAETGNFDQAEKAANVIQDPMLKVFARSSIALNRAKGGKSENSPGFFVEVLQSAESIENVADRSAAYRKIATALSDSGNQAAAMDAINKAARFAGRIESVETKSDVLLGIAEARAKIGPDSEAAGSFEQAVQAANRIKDPATKVDRLCRIAGSQADSGDRKGALVTLSSAVGSVAEIENPIYKGGAMVRLAEVQIKLREKAQAISTIQAAVAFAVEKSQEAEHAVADDILQEISELQIRTGDLSAAEQTGKKMDSKGHGISWVRASLAGAQAEAGDITSAIATADEIKGDEERKADAYRGIARGWAKSGDAGKSLAWARTHSTPILKASALLGWGEGVIGRKKE